MKSQVIRMMQLARFWVTGLLLALCAGCAEVVTFNCSFPAAEGMIRPPAKDLPEQIRSELVFSDRSRGLVICQDGLDLVIRPHDDVSVKRSLWTLLPFPVWQGCYLDSSPRKPPFRIDVALRSRHNGFVFRPNLIALRLTNDVIVTPAGYYGPWPTSDEVQAEIGPLWADMSVLDKLGLSREAARKRSRLNEAEYRLTWGVWDHCRSGVDSTVNCDDTNRWYRLVVEFNMPPPLPGELAGLQVKGVTRNGVAWPSPGIPFKQVSYKRAYGIP